MIRDYDYEFKVVIVGNSSVGKSALLRRFADDTFQQSYLTTIGVDFRFKTITVNGSIVKLQIWDTAGQEQFRTITSTYYRGAHGILMVYDIGNEKSYQDIKSFWLKQIDNYSQPNARLALVGNKSDSENKIVSQQDVKKYSDSKNLLSYQVSAKTGDGVAKIFTDLSEQLMKIHPKSDTVVGKNSVIEGLNERKKNFKMKSGTDQVNKKQGGCC